MLYIIFFYPEKKAFYYISADGTFFSHLNNKQQWVIGPTNFKMKEIRFKIIENRDPDILKQIIEKHVLPGKYITTDALKDYAFLNYRGN